MLRRIERVPAFHQSAAALPQSPVVPALIRALIGRATARPEEAEVLAGTNARAVYNERLPGYPRLRLFYSIDDTTIYLLHIEDFDDLPDDE